MYREALVLFSMPLVNTTPMFWCFTDILFSLFDSQPHWDFVVSVLVKGPCAEIDPAHSEFRSLSAT